MSGNFLLLLIDIQKGFAEPYWGSRNNPHAEENMSKLIQYFRRQQLPIYHVQHLSQNPNSPLAPSSPGVEFMDFAKPRLGERVFQKRVNSAFIGTELEKILRNIKIEKIIVAGISTDHCVSTSVRMASNLGFETTVVADATIAFDRVGFDGARYAADDVHALALASLHDEFATVINTAELLATLTEQQTAQMSS